MTPPPLPIFSGSFIESAPKMWVWGPPAKEQDRLEDHLKAITILKERGLHGVGVIGVYHVRMLAPLMARALPMYLMMPQSPLDGMVMLARDALSVCEVEQCLKEVTEVLASSSGEMVPIPSPEAPTDATEHRLCQIHKSSLLLWMMFKLRSLLIFLIMSPNPLS
jgi:hypothetical protein